MIPNSVFRLLVLCGAMAIQVFGMVSCACSSQPKGDDNNTTSANVASMTIELSDSLLRVGPTSDTIDLGRMYAGEVIRRDTQCRSFCFFDFRGKDQLWVYSSRFLQKAYSFR